MIYWTQIGSRRLVFASISLIKTSIVITTIWQGLDCGEKYSRQIGKISHSWIKVGLQYVNVTHYLVLGCEGCCYVVSSTTQRQKSIRVFCQRNCPCRNRDGYVFPTKNMYFDNEIFMCIRPDVPIRYQYVIFIIARNWYGIPDAEWSSPIKSFSIKNDGYRFLFSELNIGAQQWHLPNLMFWVLEFLTSFPYAHSVNFALKLNVEKSSVDNAYLTNPNYIFPTQLQD